MKNPMGGYLEEKDSAWLGTRLIRSFGPAVERPDLFNCDTICLRARPWLSNVPLSGSFCVCANCAVGRAFV